MAKGLGKGFGALIDENSYEIEGKSVTEVRISDVEPDKNQPRREFEPQALEELSQSIKQHGVISPIVVTKIENDRYRIIAGERRVKASSIAGKKTIPAIIKDFTDAEMMEIAVLENLQRENLNPIEEAEAYKKLIDTLQITQEELGRRLGKSRTYITNTVGLLSLPEMVKTLVTKDKISMGHARILSKIENDEKVLELTNRIINEHLSVREVEDIVAKGDFHKKNPIQKLPRTNEYKYVEESLFDKFGTKVKIKNKRILISFENDNDLNRILEIIGVSSN